MPTKSNNNNQTVAAGTGRENVYIDLYVRSRTTNFFKGQVASITSVNQTGIFDVLPMHANFVTLVKDYIILDKDKQTEKKIDFKTAVLSVLNGKVDIYVGV